MKNSEMIIYNGTVLTPARRINDGVVVVIDSKVEEIGKRGSVPEPESAVRIDASGNIITAGFIDIHVHGSMGVDVADLSQEAYETMSQFFASRGVTSFAATALTLPHQELITILEHARSIKGNGNLSSAELLGVHLEGPFLNFEQRGCHPEELLLAPKPDHYTPFLDYNDVLMEMTLAPELKGAPELVRELKKAGIVAAAGHTNGIYPQMMPAINEGISHAVHFFCNMGHFRRDQLKRVAGAMETLLYDDRISTEIIADGWHIGETLMKLVVKIKGIDRVCFVTDAMSAAGMPPGLYSIGGVEAIVEGGCARLPDNTAYAGSVTSMDLCVRNGIEKMKLSLSEALAMASSTPASIIGVDHRKGSLEKGKDADIIIIDENVNVCKTIVRGNLVYNSAPHG